MNTTLMGGSVLDTPEKAAAAAEHPPEHTGTCARCGQRFFRTKPTTGICRGCWYEAEMEDAATRFRPLSEHLERILEVETSVDQTGGMTMCLRVPIGRVLEGESQTRRWAWFGELSEYEQPGMGLYEVDDQGEYVVGEDVEDYHEWPGTFQCGEGHRNCRWYHHSDVARQVAEWAAPIIVEFASRGADR